MEPTAKEGWGFNGRTTGIKWPLLGSAAGHAFLLASLLLLGAAAGPGAGNVVQVILVEGAQFAPSSDEKFIAASRGGAPLSKTARHEAINVPRRLPSTAVPALPPTSLRAATSQSPEAIVEKGATLPAATAEAPAPGPAKEEAAPSSAQPPFPSPVAATPSGGTVLVALIRAGGGAAPTAFPAEGGPRASGDGSGASGSAVLGTAAPLVGVSGSERTGGEDGTAARLRDAIQSRMVYPDEAVRRGQEGEVLLHIRIGKGGSPGEIRVVKSSGARILDEAARRGVVRAAPLPSAPGWVEVPVRFVLQRPAGERP